MYTRGGRAQACDGDMSDGTRRGRTARAGSLAVAFGLTVAVATGLGQPVASAETSDGGDSNSSASSDSDSESSPAEDDSDGVEGDAADGDDAEVGEGEEDEPEDVENDDSEDPVSEADDSEDDDAADDDPEDEQVDEPVVDVTEPDELESGTDNETVVEAEPPAEVDEPEYVASKDDQASTPVEFDYTATVSDVTAPEVVITLADESSADGVDAVATVPVALQSVSARQPSAPDPADIVFGLLGAVGLMPATYGGLPRPLSPHALTGLIYLAFRRIQTTFFNHEPTARVVVNPQDMVTGEITGAIVGRDWDRDPLTYTVDAEPTNGTVVVNPDGTFVYTPSDELAATGGTDQFTVNVSDDSYPHINLLDLWGHRHTVTKTVTLQVAAVNEGPVQELPTELGEPDPSDGAVDGDLHVVDPNGDPLSYELTSGPSRGGLVLNDDGTFTYTPTPEARDDAAAEVEPITEDTFTVVVSDGVESLEIEVVVPIDPVNSAPVQEVSTELGEPDPTDGAVDGDLHVVDPNGNPLSYELTGGPSRGDLVLNDDGTFTYTPTPEARDDAAAEVDPITEDTFTLVVSDGIDTLEIEVVVPIDPVNSAPVQEDPTELGEPDPIDGAVDGDLHVVDPNGNPLSYELISGPTRGELVLNDDGTFTYTPFEDARHDAAAEVNPVTEDTFTVVVSDGVDTLEIEVTVTIDPQNAEPEVTLTPGGSQTGIVPINYTVGVTDEDEGDVHTVTATGAQHGTVTVSGNTVTYTPNVAYYENQVGTVTDTFVITVDDGHGGTETVVATYTVTSGVQVVQTIPSVTDGSGLAVLPDGSAVVVVGTTNDVQIIPTSPPHTRTDVDVPGANPFTVIMSRDGKTLYATNRNLGFITVIDTETGASRNIPLSTTFAGEALTEGPDGTIYVVGANRAFGGPTVYAVDPVTNVVTPFEVNPDATQRTPTWGVAISEDGEKLYVGGNGQLDVYDAETGALLDTIEVSQRSTKLESIVAVPGTANVYTGAEDGTLSLVDTDTGEITTVIPAPVDAMVLSEDGKYLYAAGKANPSTYQVYVVDVETNEVVAEHVLPFQPNSDNGYIQKMVVDENGTVYALKMFGSVYVIAGSPFTSSGGVQTPTDL